MTSLDARLLDALGEAKRGNGPLVFLTGAGISAESGIPTFRGAEGFWTVGSRNYRPEELATRSAFLRMPEELWAWYLYRRSACRAAQPNAAHRALVDAERSLGNRFLLVTQNVDGLHLRAGNSRERSHEIHGNIDYHRCEAEYPAVRPLPEAIPVHWPKERRLTDAERAALACCPGGDFSRPHVLWFDEYYDEPLFRFESALEAGRSAELLVVIGTSGATNLPSQLVSLADRRGIPLVVVNQDESPFTELAERSESGFVLRGTATEWVPRIVEALIG